MQDIVLDSKQIQQLKQYVLTHWHEVPLESRFPGSSRNLSESERTAVCWVMGVLDLLHIEKTVMLDTTPYEPIEE